MALTTFGLRSVTERGFNDGYFASGAKGRSPDGGSGYRKTKLSHRSTRGGIGLTTWDTSYTNAKINKSGAPLKRVSTPIDSFHENIGGKGVLTSMTNQHTYHLNVPAIAGTAAAAYGGYKLYQHRDDVRSKFHNTVNSLHI